MEVGGVVAKQAARGKAAARSAWAKRLRAAAREEANEYAGSPGSAHW
jgi:hypothetical protein